jgi:cell division transport system ATP-binding protein
LFNLFRQLNGQGVTVLVASHDLSLIRSMGRRVLVLANGRLADDIAAAEIRGGGS